MSSWSHSLLLTSCLFAPISLTAAATNLTIGNQFITRELSLAEGKLKTVKISNALAKQIITPTSCEEFTIAYRTDSGNASHRVTSNDFQITNSETLNSTTGQQLTVHLTSKSTPFTVAIHYTAATGEPWMRKQLTITAKKPIIIEKAEVENLTIADAYSPYNANQLTAQGSSQWRPPLGQPLYTRSSATWWGMEFPAARNEVKDGNLICGYLTQISLQNGQSWKSHTAAVGVGDDPLFIKDAFFSYIDATRARPLRLQTQYNSWFDFGQAVNEKNFITSVEKVHDELCVKRGVPPLRSYVIDDGWQDNAQDWTKSGVWPINGKFSNDFTDSKAAVAAAKSSLGLWLSPGCLFGAQGAIPKMREGGWQALAPWMSMTGEKYMAALELRMLALAASGVEYFKLDGVFGHLNTRNFAIEGFQGSEAELNDAKHDAAKERYLSLGSERLIQIFSKMAKVNPDLYIVISNGAFLSPWWLQHIDAVWMINADDAAAGAGRTDQLVYRDAVYYRLAAANVDNTQFPLNSIFNHEPKKTSTGESKDTFYRYLLMNFSRGTGFAELYLKTATLSEGDWTVLADAMKWLHRLFPTFKNARMIGGDPAKREVYGYTGWTDTLGYVSLHNPSNEIREYIVTFDRTLGLTAKSIADQTTFSLTSPLAVDLENLEKSIKPGSQIKLTLPPASIRILEFHKK